MRLEALVAILVTLIFGLLCVLGPGAPFVNELLEGHRANLYSALASIFGALLGFVITVTSIVLALSSSESLTILRESTQYQSVWTTFRSTTWVLAWATVVALACLLLDRDQSPSGPLMVALVFVVILTGFRLARTLCVMDNVVSIVTAAQAKQRKASSA